MGKGDVRGERRKEDCLGNLRDRHEARKEEDKEGGGLKEKLSDQNGIGERE